MPAIDRWKEKLQCPKCGKTGMASLSQINGNAPIVETVPAGFEVVGENMARISIAHRATSR
jgi:hypothetical protein